MKTAEEITHELLISGDTVGYQRTHVIWAMKEYASQALSSYRSKILHLEDRTNDIDVVGIDFDELLP